jgi:ferredoxin
VSHTPTEAGARPDDTPAEAPAGRGVRVKVHPGLCEGHGVCRRFAPTVYQLDDEGYLDLHLVEVGPELAADARFGAIACPALVITIEELD